MSTIMYPGFEGQVLLLHLSIGLRSVC